MFHKKVMLLFNWDNVSDFGKICDIEKSLKQGKYDVVNPTSLFLEALSQKVGVDINEDNYNNYLFLLCEIDKSVVFKNIVSQVFDCDGVVLLGDWYKNKSAILIMKIADQSGKNLYEFFDNKLSIVDKKKIGMKLSEKPLMELVDLNFITNIARVLTYGMNKYSADSWKNVPDGINQYRGAILRHLTAIQNGEFIDEESGLLHTSHIGTNAMFLEYFINQKIKEV